MKALVLKKPGEASIETVPDPRLTDGNLMLRVRMVGFCGSDLNSFRGLNPLVSYPRILGHEVSATVLENAQFDNRFSAGVDVAVSPYSNCGKCASCLRSRANACQFNETLGVQRDGALSEFVALPPERLFRAGLTLKELCLVEPLTVGFHAVSRGRVTANDTVAVFGCGGVGLGAVAASSSRGARTISIDIDDEKLEFVRLTFGAITINSAKESLHKRLAEITDGRGPDVIIEAVGNPETFRSAVEEVAHTGRVIYIGYAKQPVSYETKLFVQKELDILGSRNAQAEDFNAVIRLMETGKLPVEDFVSLVVPLEEAPEALRSWSKNPSGFKKILVSLD